MKLGEVAKIAKGDLWVIPRYEAYITGRRLLQKERDALVQIMSRPERVRTETFSASGAGQCIRRRQLAYLGYPQRKLTERTANIFANGDYVHLRFQVAGLVGGWLRAAEVSVGIRELDLTGTLDGILSNGEGLEIKSINSRGFGNVSSFGVKREHKEQVHSYMLAGGFDAFRVVYENKDTQQLKEFRVERDQKLVDKIIDDLETLKELKDSKHLAPMLGPCVEQRGEDYRWCPYQAVCPKAKYEPYESPVLHIQRTSSTPSD